MEKSIPEASLTCSPQTCEVLCNVTFSLEFQVGVWLCNWLDGLARNLCGLEAAPASHSVSQVREKAPKTNDTCGPSLPNSSEPASLQSRLANKLRQRLDVNGSPEYSLTWKEWGISGQEPICALHARLNPTCESDFIGLPTPTSHAVLELTCPALGGRVRVLISGALKKKSKNGIEGSMNWSQWVLAKGWLPTPKLALFFMGYPSVWLSCAEQAMLSCRKSPRSSSAPTSKAKSPREKIIL